MTGLVYKICLRRTYPERDFPGNHLTKPWVDPL
jgi:hypothetical protein